MSMSVLFHYQNIKNTLHQEYIYMYMFLV